MGLVGVELGFVPRSLTFRSLAASRRLAASWRKKTRLLAGGLRTDSDDGGSRWFLRWGSRLLAGSLRMDSGDGGGRWFSRWRSCCGWCFGLEKGLLRFSVLTFVLHGMGPFIFEVSGVGGKPLIACCTRLACPVAIRRLQTYMVCVRKCRRGRWITVWS